MSLYLSQLILNNFKNYEHQEMYFSPQLNGFTGKNGMGKTNMLDAIYYLCMCKSQFGIRDSFVKRHEASFFRLEGHFLRQEKKEKIVAKVIPRKRKEIERNQVVYKKLSEHVGLLPIVFIAPDDTMIVKEGSEERRRFLDNSLSQLDAQYLNCLIFYNKVLRQRNASLKKMAAEKNYDTSLIQAYNTQLLQPAQYIHNKRTAFLQQFSAIFQQLFNKIAGEKESVSCEYQSKLTHANFEVLLEEAFEKDCILQRTTTGIHKDDLNFKINNFSLKKFGSQGQLKSFVLSLKLAQYELLKRHKAVKPILLLDDIFDKLDESRVQQLMQLLLEQDFGQIFITDTHESRLEQIIKKFSDDYRIFVVENGNASKQ